MQNIRQNFWNYLFFLLFMIAAAVGIYYFDQNLINKQKEQLKIKTEQLEAELKASEEKKQQEEKEKQEKQGVQAALLGGAGGASAGGAGKLENGSPKKADGEGNPTAAAKGDQPKANAAVAPAAAVPALPALPQRLIPLGDANSRERILLTTKGGGVQQVILNDFDEADRSGRVVVDNTVNRKLHLIPGYYKAWSLKVLPLPEHIELKPGNVPDDIAKNVLSEPCYTILHYPSKGDPVFRAEDPEAENFPSAELSTRIWNVVSEDASKVVFETELAAPYFLKLRKTFSLDPKAYHFDFSLEMEPLPGRTKESPQFRYQISGARGLPIEGEWYTQTFRNAYVGQQDISNPQKFYRHIEESVLINDHFGGEKIPKANRKLIYATIGTQYFASGVAVDVRENPNFQPWAYVRPTRELNVAVPNQLKQVDDITIRAVSEPIELHDGKAVTHKYVVYNGPIKVQLLGQLAGEKAVDAELVKFYSESLGLTTMTDYHSNFFLGRFANSIGLTSAIIFFTNIMHKVLGWLHAFVPIWGLNIIMLTVLVRLLLMPFSRRQQMIGAKMQAKMAAHQPEIEKLKEKYKNDTNAFNQAKTKYMLENGMLNPGAQAGGCLLLFIQMPIFMGLYFCLQESIFFRLSPFVWIKNLAAPDMLLGWTESVPFISDAANRVGFPSFSYLGPFFNLLPLISVSLMFIHMTITMPPAMDDMQKQQQSMMKFMMIIMALMFYKMASGLALYFICSTLWGLAEKKLLPKPVAKPEPLKSNVGSNGKVGGPVQKGFFGRMMERMEEMQKAQDAQRQIRNEPRDDKNDKKKKR